MAGGKKHMQRQRIMGVSSFGQGAIEDICEDIPMTVSTAG